MRRAYGFKSHLPHHLPSALAGGRFFIAGMAELAVAYGSGPYEGSFMQVQVLFPAPEKHDSFKAVVLFLLQHISAQAERKAMEAAILNAISELSTS